MGYQYRGSRLVEWWPTRKSRLLSNNQWRHGGRLYAIDILRTLSLFAGAYYFIPVYQNSAISKSCSVSFAAPSPDDNTK